MATEKPSANPSFVAQGYVFMPGAAGFDGRFYMRPADIVLVVQEGQFYHTTMVDGFTYRLWNIAFDLTKFLDTWGLDLIVTQLTSYEDNGRDYDKRWFHPDHLTHASMFKEDVEVHSSDKRSYTNEAYVHRILTQPFSSDESGEVIISKIQAWRKAKAKAKNKSKLA